MNIKKCKRHRQNKIEDDAHILAACNHNKNLITKQHDYVVKKITKQFISNHQNTRVWRERSWTMGMELLRQDITMVKDDEVIIVEVTIPYETSNQYLEQRRQDKIRKYEKLLQEDRLLQVQCNKGTIVPITIGALGLLEQSQIAPIKIFINLNFRNKI